MHKLKLPPVRLPEDTPTHTHKHQHTHTYRYTHVCNSSMALRYLRHRQRHHSFHLSALLRLFRNLNCSSPAPPTSPLSLLSCLPCSALAACCLGLFFCFCLSPRQSNFPASFQAISAIKAPSFEVPFAQRVSPFLLLDFNPLPLKQRPNEIPECECVSFLMKI